MTAFNGWGSSWGGSWGPVDGGSNGYMRGAAGFELSAVAQAVAVLFAEGASIASFAATGTLTAAATGGPVDLFGSADFGISAFGIILDGNEPPILRRIFAAPTGGGPGSQVTLEQVITAKRKKREREEILLLL